MCSSKGKSSSICQKKGQRATYIVGAVCATACREEVPLFKREHLSILAPRRRIETKSHTYYNNFPCSRFSFFFFPSACCNFSFLSFLGVFLSSSSFSPVCYRAELRPFLSLRNRKRRKLAAQAASLAARPALGSATARQLTHTRPNLRRNQKRGLSTS